MGGCNRNDAVEGVGGDESTANSGQDSPELPAEAQHLPSELPSPSQCADEIEVIKKLKRIGQAMHNHHDQHRHLPPAMSTTPDYKLPNANYDHRKAAERKSTTNSGAGPTCNGASPPSCAIAARLNAMRWRTVLGLRSKDGRGDASVGCERLPPPATGRTSGH